MQDLFKLLYEKLSAGMPIAMATVVRQQGSAPRGAGSKLLADAQGLLAGSVGGGLAEGQSIAACREALEQKQTRILDFNLSGELAAKADMICGGQVRVLLAPLYPDTETLKAVGSLLQSLQNNDDGAVLITHVNAALPPRYTVLRKGHCFGAPVPPAALDAIVPRLPQATEAWLHQTADGGYFVEPCLPPFRLILAGGGHISRPTAQVAALVGFSVTVLDDREEFSQPQRFPWAASTRTTPDFHDCFSGCTPNARTCIVIVTRGHLHDAAVLRQALATQAGYVGMIGSKRKREEVYAQLRQQGIAPEALKRVHCPVGLHIGAETPEEIAVSIVAQCISYRSQTCMHASPAPQP